jgi:uncharacterized Ntn-hydrolase superfamily protein
MPTPHPSTFSIVAHDTHAKEWGIAVASKFPAVGAIVPWARAGAGAIATQSFANTSFGPTGLDLMSSGITAQDTLTRLLADDPGREHRQIGVVDALGVAATFTGKECYQWADGLTGVGYAIQGNILSGSNVIQTMQSTFLDSAGDLATRLHAALLSGDRAGGDKRGRQSAAILVVQHNGGYGGFNDRKLDYRVDDDIDPVVRLGELIYLHRLYFDKSSDTEVVQLSDDTVLQLQLIMNKLGYFKGEIDGKYNAETQIALSEFIGNENFEERANPSAGLIDRPVLEYLFRKFET